MRDTVSLSIDGVFVCFSSRCHRPPATSYAPNHAVLGTSALFTLPWSYMFLRTYPFDVCPLHMNACVNVSVYGWMDVCICVCIYARIYRCM